MELQREKQNLRVQKWVAILSVVILLVKFSAYYLTNSIAILTDALESIVNVSAGFIGLYSLYIAAKPRDVDHPYGHGKAEFISAAIEGTLIASAGAIIIYKAVKGFIAPEPIEKLDTGIWLIAVSALANLMIALFCIRTGKRNNSMALLASGRHLQTDVLSTFGIIVGLGILYFTKLRWIDSAVALIFGAIIMWEGYKILRKSIAGIMDEADEELLKQMVEILNKVRRDNWVDLHNLRVIKYGAVLHLDCHLTLPWYLNVHEAHKEIDLLAEEVRNDFGETLELFVHTDGCLPFSCKLCSKMECGERKNPFERKLDWTLQNISSNKKHEL
jgi:cation diffusion facilitator family transporter